MNKRFLKTLFGYFIIGLCYLYVIGLMRPLEEDISIDYVNGLFTVASILTGFLVAIITIEPRSTLEEFYRDEVFGYMIMINLGLLGVAIVFYTVVAIFRLGFLYYTFFILDMVIIFDIGAFWIAFPNWLEARRKESERSKFR